MDRASDQNPWDLVLQRVRLEMEPEDFRRWFSSTSYAGDSGDQINVWIGSEAIRRHIETHFREELDHALASLNRPDTLIRFIVAGFGDEEDEEKENL
jgi:chromosomal replication initiation ATPase DnaA